MLKKREIKSLDINPVIGEVQISGTDIVLDVPKLSALRIFEIVRFLGTEAAKVWNKAREIAMDSSYTEQEVIMKVLEIIPADMMPNLLSILLDIDEESAANLDLNDILEIALVYVQNTDLKKTFFQIQKIYKEIYGRDLPNLAALLPSQEQVEAAKQEAEPEAETVEAGKK